jgi:hypothetical protein
MYFHELPLPRPYTAEWNGFVDVPMSDTYHFRLMAVGDAELFIDGKLILDTPAPREAIEASMELSAGQHPIRVRFHDTLPYSEIRLEWKRQNETTYQAIPSRALIPALNR